MYHVFKCGKRTLAVSSNKFIAYCDWSSFFNQTGENLISFLLFRKIYQSEEIQNS